MSLNPKLVNTICTLLYENILWNIIVKCEKSEITATKNGETNIAEMHTVAVV